MFKSNVKRQNLKVTENGKGSDTLYQRGPDGGLETGVVPALYHMLERTEECV